METWYQINPDYFAQIFQTQELEAKPSKSELKLFEFLKLKLDYIASLGCTGIWFMPIFQRGQTNKKGPLGSPYAIKDYQINTKYGSRKDLLSLIDLAHKKKLKIICGYVPNHLSEDAPFIRDNKEVAYKKQDGSFYYDQNWIDTVKLNHSHYLTKGYTSANLKWLTKDLKLDGFRLDMAHYVFHGAKSRDLSLISQGQGDLKFWQQIFFNSPELKKKYWLAEVYDDRDKNYAGYADQIRLLKEDIYVYDKKTHDLLAWKLKHKDPNFRFSEIFYQELEKQSKASEFSQNKTWKEKEWPFLRFVANHDDTPALKIFGGIKEVILAYWVLGLLPGEFMIYAGEEFALSVKPSIIGANCFSESGECLEANQIKLASKEQQIELNQSIKKILQLRKEETLIQKGQLSILVAENKDQSPNHQVFCFLRYSLVRKGLILVVVNLSSCTQWVRLNKPFPKLINQDRFDSLQDLILQTSSSQEPKKYKLSNLISEEAIERDFHSEFWVGLEALEVQIYKIRS